MKKLLLIAVASLLLSLVSGSMAAPMEGGGKGKKGSAEARDYAAEVARFKLEHLSMLWNGILKNERGDIDRVRGIIQDWLSASPDAAMRWMDGRKDGIEKENAFFFLAWCKASKDPEAAVAWAKKFESKEPWDPTRVRMQYLERVSYAACHGIALGWSERDPGKAADWIRTIRHPWIRDDLSVRYTDYWAMKDPVKAAAFAGSIEGVATRNSALGRAVRRGAKTHPEQAARWAKAIRDYRKRSPAPLAPPREGDEATRKEVARLLAMLEKHTGTTRLHRALENLQDRMTVPELLRALRIFRDSLSNAVGLPDWLLWNLMGKDHPDVAPAFVSFVEACVKEGVLFRFYHDGKGGAVIDYLAKKGGEDGVTALITLASAVAGDIDPRVYPVAHDELAVHLCRLLGDLGDKRAVDVLNRFFNAAPSLQKAAEKALAKLGEISAGKPIRLCGFLYKWPPKPEKPDPDFDMFGSVQRAEDPHRKKGHVYVDAINFMAGAHTYWITDAAIARPGKVAGNPASGLVQKLKWQAKPPLSYEECRKEGLIGAMSCGTHFSKTLVLLEGRALKTWKAGSVGAFECFMTEVVPTEIVWVHGYKPACAMFKELEPRGKEVLAGRTMKEAEALEAEGKVTQALEKYRAVRKQFGGIATGKVRLEDLMAIGDGGDLCKNYSHLRDKIESLARMQRRQSADTPKEMIERPAMEKMRR